VHDRLHQGSGEAAEDEQQHAVRRVSRPIIVFTDDTPKCTRSPRPPGRPARSGTSRSGAWCRAGRRARGK
jgi:hypothetical protein